MAGKAGEARGQTPFVVRRRVGRPALPHVLPCGCRIKNKQGATLLTEAQLNDNGTRTCRSHRRTWQAVLRFIEVKP
jgi:hypothetical protein